MFYFKVRAFCVVFVSISAAVLLIGCGDEGDDFVYTGGTVKIGNLTWMAENLNRKTSGSWCYDDDNSNCEKYGRLYTWGDALKVCPSGWRLPTHADWDNLISATGGSTAAGGKLKSETGWNNRISGGSGNGTDEFGFSALPGGYRHANGYFTSINNNSYWWSATEVEVGSGVYYRTIDRNYDRVSDLSWSGNSGLSVRCVVK